MAQECELLLRCGLFKKYQPTNEWACRWLFEQYCSGLGITECRRKAYYLEHDKPPSDDMLPSGAMIVVDLNVEDIPACP